MKKRADFLGLEFDWFAIDSDGFIALISSAGYGPIPDLVFERFDEQRCIETYLSSLIGLGLSSDLLRVARTLSTAGVFSYDWEHWDGPYRRLGVPTRPIRFDKLGFSPELRIGFVELQDHFSTAIELRLELCSQYTQKEQ
jgi:hypothetical protein